MPSHSSRMNATGWIWLSLYLYDVFATFEEMGLFNVKKTSFEQVS